MSVNSKRLDQAMQSEAGQVTTRKRHSRDPLHSVDSPFGHVSTFCLARHCIPRSQLPSSSVYISNSQIFLGPLPRALSLNSANPTHAYITHYILLNKTEDINYATALGMCSPLEEARINQVNQLEKC